MNSRTGARRLPPELLAEVFYLAQTIWPPQRARNVDGFLPRYDPGWMTVLHVCATWRRVALSAPMLWQQVSALDVHPDSAPDILARSASMGLRLLYKESFTESRRGRLDEHGVRSQRVWLTAPNLRRTETLEICYLRLEPDVRLLKLLEQEAPSVHTLCIQGMCGTFLPPRMLGPSHPKLCRLSLSCCTIYSSSGFLAPTLTHLKLELVAYDGAPFSVPRLLSAISAMKSLKYLHLKLYALDDVSGQASPTVTPSALKYMMLDMRWNHRPVAAFTALLNHLSIPPSARLLVYTYPHGEWDGAVWQQVFSSVFACGSSSDRHLELDLAGHAQWCLYRCHPATGTRMGNRRMVVVPLSEDTELRDIIAFARPQSLVIGPRFWYDTFYMPEAAALRDAIPAAQDVRRFATCHCHFPSLWHTLAGRPKLFPLLQAIVLKDAYCAWRLAGDNSDEAAFEFRKEELETHECILGPFTSSVTLSSIAGLVQMMRNAGVPVREVKIEGQSTEWRLSASKPSDAVGD